MNVDSNEKPARLQSDQRKHRGLVMRWRKREKWTQQEQKKAERQIASDYQTYPEIRRPDSVRVRGS